jgi:sugar phosphate isomerase/epimerase
MLERLGIQSYTFRTFDTIEKLADALQAAGISRLEAWPGHICHDHPAAETAQKVAYLAKRGISLSGYGGVALYNNEEEMREMFAFARDYGIGAMTLVDMKDDCLELVERLAEDYDVYLAAHNHGKNHWIGTRERLDAFFSKTSSRFGVCLDTAWAIHAGEDPIEMALYYKDRLLGVHLKDFVYDEASAKHKDVIIGSGGLDLPRFMKTLKDIDFKGYISLEYEGNAENPLPETQRCVQALKAALA